MIEARNFQFLVLGLSAAWVVVMGYMFYLVRRDKKLIQKTIDRLAQYQHMADFGTCAVDWPLLDEWEKDVLEGRMPDFSR